MSISQLQIVILNHREDDIKKFSKNTAAVKYYQEGNTTLINELYKQWFGIFEACIIAHHLSDIEDMKENINYVIAINSQHSVQYELNKPKGKRLRYVFIFFYHDENSAREIVFQMLRPVLLENIKNPIDVQIEYHNVTFI